MNFFIKKSIIVLIPCSILFALGSCGHKENKTQEATKPGTKEVAEPALDEASETIVMLTPEQIKSINLQLGKVENKELRATIKANGLLRVPNEHKGKATSLFSGVVKALNVQLGSYVRKGQVIAVITNPQFIQLQEEYLATGSKITLAQQEQQRQKELNEGNAGALKNLQSATADLNALRTRRASLQQQIQLMGINPTTLNNENMHATLTVTSPVSGTVSNLYAQIGSYVDVASPVAEIVDNSALHLDLNVYEKDLPLIKLGQTIHFTLTNNPTHEYDATVFSIGAAFENDSKTIPVHCTVKSDKTGLIDGMNITGIVSLNKAVTPAVPDNAIVSSGGNNYVFIVTDKKTKDTANEEKGTMRFEKTEVVKGISEMGYTAVTFVKDIPANAQIVTNGAFFINAKLTNTDEGDE
ncbi:efflux transporter periplasmic adaptor subunit [Arachidicoccus ginsenosidimutans]|uniref:efflux RND transporter periplasmic adaptor subunit n=1 Tax=Arachidicoccus sp. BS20 TaxID=1850526 RepID=UPI0007F0BAC3|nr:efflux RND transporter periplasmic adaptor subunit [Arachidicoccus sp. BS20]ANI88249.1 efflux transporter periplasmic adaptor subunit [Arachidicoccus sp. BS20]